MTADDSFTTLLTRLRDGDPGGVEIVFRRFTCRLVALARARLDDRLRSRVDAEDLVQSVFRVFCTQLCAAELEVVGWEGLWGLLARLTVCKCADRARHHTAARRDCRRDAALPAAVFARDPGPEEAAEVADLLETLLRGWEPHERDILTLHLEGHTLDEVARRVGRARRTVQRTVERGRNRLRRLLAARPTPLTRP